jgi:hypothetical protein
MSSQLSLQCRPPWDEGEAEPVVNHREPARGEVQAFATSFGDVLAFSKRPIGKAGLRRNVGNGRVERLPAERFEQIPPRR